MYDMNLQDVAVSTVRRTALQFAHQISLLPTPPSFDFSYRHYLTTRASNDLCKYCHPSPMASIALSICLFTQIIFDDRPWCTHNLVANKSDLEHITGSTYIGAFGESWRIVVT